MWPVPVSIISVAVVDFSLQGISSLSSHASMILSWTMSCHLKVQSHVLTGCLHVQC